MKHDRKLKKRISLSPVDFETQDEIFPTVIINYID